MLEGNSKGIQMTKDGTAANKALKPIGGKERLPLTRLSIRLR